MPNISLSDAIANLRQELQLAMQASAGEPLRFQLDQIDMEFEVAVTQEGGGKAGIKWWLIEAGAEAKLSRSATHKIKLALTPVTSDGRTPQVANPSPKPD